MADPLHNPSAAQPLGVLVVDDSALYRQMLVNLVTGISGAEVVGTATDGVEAIAMIADLQPDVVTLDLVMPNLDGFGVLREIKRRKLQTQVVVVSSTAEEKAAATVDALLLGAFDCILKPLGMPPHIARNEIGRALAVRLGEILESKAAGRKSPRLTTPTAAGSIDAARKPSGGCIAIGASTGGPAALRVILSQLTSAPSVPVFVVQHMPLKFIESLAARLDEMATFPVRLATDGLRVVAGTVYMAPAGFHLRVAANGGRHVCRLADDPPLHGCRPSYDRLLESLAEAYGSGVTAAVLTGMGRDGAAGCRLVKEAGGMVVAQHQASCAVYGMPKAVIEAGLADLVLPLDMIGKLFVGEHGPRRTGV